MPTNYSREGIPIPSSNKTLHLQLNKWLGSDKPKKDDFNADNQKIDDACNLLSKSVEKIEEWQKTNSYATQQSVTSLSGTVTSLSGAVTSHTGNTAVHVTAAEKTAWNSGAGLVTGYYTGNGSTSQKVTLGYQPKFGLIFAVGYGMVYAAWTSEQLQNYCGCMSRLGCSDGITLNSDGFTVNHTSSGGVDGNPVRFNTLNIRYVYFIWK